MPKAIGLFWLQFRVLVWKNWIISSKNPFLFILRCFLLPIAYGVFLSFAQFMLHRLNNYNPGSPAPIPTLKDHFDGTSSLYLLDATQRSSSDLPSPLQIMNRTLQDFTPEQLHAVNVLSDPLDIPKVCPQNFNGFSGCYAVVIFTDMQPNSPTPHGINYTILADAGLSRIDVERHTSDVVTRILPLQWAIDKSIIELQTNVSQQTPLEWGYSNQTNAQQETAIRLSYDRGIREIIGLAFFLTFTGIVYQIPGSVANERALLITEHMKAMGLYDSARILSWHVGISLTYLPAWIVVALLWKVRIFVETSGGLIVLVHVLLGLVLASWSFVVAVPFGGSPQLAAVVTTFLSVIFAIFGMLVNTSNTLIMVFFSIIFPPSFYIFALKSICGYENHQMATDPSTGDPDSGILLAPLLLVAIIDIVIWPFLAVFLERYLYSTAALLKPKSKRFPTNEYPAQAMPPNTAISVRSLTKIYSTSWFSGNGDVTAVSNLNLDIPKTGIFVMLGSNGAGKSTSLSIMAGLSSITSGTVTFEGGHDRPPRGVLGIVPQKNVLFAELTCMQTLRVWRAVKWCSSRYETDEDLEQLLRDCDLGKKIHANAATLSGGQKRKLQLAIGLLGGSKIILVDECTSGVDPLSRRALWKTLSAFRDDRCIVFTTHFLDEADLLADHIAILAAPGKVVASGSPVALKSQLGEGYSVQVTFGSLLVGSEAEKLFGYSTLSYDFLHAIRMIVPDAYATKPSPSISVYHLKTRDSHIVGQVLNLLEEAEQQGRIKSYDILGTTIEDIFLDLMEKEQSTGKKHVKSHSASSSLDNLSSVSLDKPTPMMDLPNGKGVSPYRQAFTIFHKRMLIVRRAWLTPLLTVLIAVTGSTIPLTFTTGLHQLCVPAAASIVAVPLWLPDAPFAKSNASQNIFPRMAVSPPNLLNTFGRLTNNLLVTKAEDNTIFTELIASDYSNFSLGGVSLGPDGNTTVAWETSPPGIRAPSMLNMASNVLLHRAVGLSTESPNLNADTRPVMIATNFGAFAKVAAATLMYLRWIFFFGAVMAVYPAFFALYVSKERRSDVQAMQLSNGLTNPVGLWLGHLMFDTIASVILSTIIIIIFATATTQFHGLGLLWIVFVLYGVTAALFSYSLSLMVSSPLAAFAIVAGYQFIMLVLYISSYLLVFTFGKVETASHITTIIHFAVSFLAPVDSVVRATLVSVNLFSLLCEGTDVVSTGSLLDIKRFGGPILYLVIHAFVLLAILVWVDSGHRYPRPLGRKKAITHRRLISTSNFDVSQFSDTNPEVADDTSLLRVVGISKTFGGKQVTDDVNLSIPRDTIFALLGPNGAGKTTTFNIIRGDVVPDTGDVFIDGASIVTNPRLARMSLGVCPQFTAIDDQLTVREHLVIYGRLKGLNRGPQLNTSIDAVLEGTSLTIYADRLASKLSGGNQRKLSLAIALLGNPSVILIDEFSTGVDPKMKRDMWQTLRRVAIGKAIVITTHSMEEASALATNVGILAKRLLALGTTASLSARYGTYEVQFVCRTREQIVKARSLMQHIPGSRMADDVATRFEVPITSGNSTYSLAQLFNTLSEHGDFMEYTVERGSLESVFLKVVKENNVREEGQSHDAVAPRTPRSKSFWKNF
ncbi:P-loop containing nucleoside triphosphate hydrolase protein [Pholiota conissans]|uniref:P-loop containing nucleoside triphosphate hydrolase protein n=1 Tax=Pholiota conissans TaxID=109636 RepID=A0A9P6CSY8_9AGAR|nr:P-loop containing nucleoside triphosphate hydrolase protein [Pholiota conissans]